MSRPDAMDYVTSNTTSVTEGPDDENLALGLLVLLFPIMLLAVTGNTLVLISYMRDARLRSVHNLFIVNLACTDFLIGCFSMPLYVMYTLQHQTWTLGRTFCTVFITIDNTLCLETVLLIILISWDRLLLVRCGLDYRTKVTMTGAYFRVAISWVLAFVLHGPANLAWTSFTGHSAVPDGECDTEFFNNFAFTLATSLVEFLLSFLLLALINASLYLRIRKRRQFARALKTLPGNASPCSCKVHPQAFSTGTPGILRKIFRSRESSLKPGLDSKSPDSNRSDKSHAAVHFETSPEHSRGNCSSGDENVFTTTTVNGESCFSPDSKNSYLCEEQRLTETEDSQSSMTGKRGIKESSTYSSNPESTSKSDQCDDDDVYKYNGIDNDSGDANDDDDADPWERLDFSEADQCKNRDYFSISPNLYPLTRERNGYSITISNPSDNQKSATDTCMTNEYNESCDMNKYEKFEGNLDTSKFDSDEPKNGEHIKGPETSDDHLADVRDTKNGLADANHTSPAESHMLPAVSHTSPAESHTSPAISHTSPAVSHTSPAVSHTSPAVSHTSPAERHTSPAVSHLSPAVSHTSPESSHTSPESSHTSPASVGTASANCTCSEKSQSQCRRDLKAAKALLALVLTFLVTWGPYTVVTIVNSACENCILPEVVDVFTWLLWSKSALNPLLYALHSPRFRYNFRQLLSCAASRGTAVAKRPR